MYKQVCVRAFIPEASVEILDRAVLHGFAGLEMNYGIAVVLALLDEEQAHELRTVIAPDGTGHATCIRHIRSYLRAHFPCTQKVQRTISSDPVNPCAESGSSVKIVNVLINPQERLLH